MSEIEKTIEELEAEVMAELEEAEDPQKKGATPAEKADKVDGVTPGGEVQDTGKAVVDPEQKDAPAKKVAAKAKEVSVTLSKRARENLINLRNLLLVTRLIMRVRSLRRIRN